MAFNTEFSNEPICTASSQYQAKKITQLKQRNLEPEEYSKEYDKIVEKTCICHDLGDGALLKYNIPYRGFEPVPAVCPGPNLIYFSRVFSLKEMVDHIYGKINILNQNRPRPHVFINELRLYIHYLKGLVLKASARMTAKEAECFTEFRKNLNEGIAYYKNLVNHFLEESEQSRERFLRELATLTMELEGVTWKYI